MISLMRVDRGSTDSLGVAECVHGDHDAGLTSLSRAGKVDSTCVGLGLEIVQARVETSVNASFDVRLGRASPDGHCYLCVRRALVGGTRVSIYQSRLVHIDIGRRPSAQTDEGA